MGPDRAGRAAGARFSGRLQRPCRGHGLRNGARRTGACHLDGAPVCRYQDVGCAPQPGSSRSRPSRAAAVWLLVSRRSDAGRRTPARRSDGRHRAGRRRRPRARPGGGPPAGVLQPARSRGGGALGVRERDAGRRLRASNVARDGGRAGAGRLRGARPTRRRSSRPPRARSTGCTRAIARRPARAGRGGRRRGQRPAPSSLRARPRARARRRSARAPRARSRRR